MSRPGETSSPPAKFDPVALASSTDKALQVLLPWYQVHNSYQDQSSEHTFARDIAEQARAYVEAINLSVVAAQIGFTVAEEALSLGNATDSTLDERNSYVEEMLKLAQKGHDNAAKTLQTFRDVRKDVLALLEKIKPEHNAVMFEFSIHVNGRMTPETKAFGALREELKDGIGVLEEFATNIDNFVTWWNLRNMEASSQETRTHLIQSKYDSLRLRGVITKWGELKDQYSTYVDKIGRIQDCYPALFVMSKNARLTEAAAIRPTGSAAARPMDGLGAEGPTGAGAARPTAGGASTTGARGARPTGVEGASTTGAGGASTGGAGRASTGGIGAGAASTTGAGAARPTAAGEAGARSTGASTTGVGGASTTGAGGARPTRAEVASTTGAGAARPTGAGEAGATSKGASTTGTGAASTGGAGAGQAGATSTGASTTGARGAGAARLTGAGEAGAATTGASTTGAGAASTGGAGAARPTGAREAGATSTRASTTRASGASTTEEKVRDEGCGACLRSLCVIM